MAKTTKSSSKKTKVKLTVKDLVISTEELMEKIESSQFEGTLDEFIKLWKTSLSEGEYQYPDYVDAVNQLKSKKYKGAFQHIFINNVLSVLKGKLTGVRLSKVIGDRLKGFSKEFNRKELDPKDGENKRVYDIVENNKKTKAKMITLTNKTLDKIESDLQKLYEKLSEREDLV